MKSKGLRIKTLERTLAEKTGLRPGDRILKIDGHPVEDELDVRFHASAEGADLEVLGADGGVQRHRMVSGEGLSGLGFAPMRSRRCGNHCLFCFVDQMPTGLRRSLYVKDEDYRFSFLYGNYVTFASVKDEELDRIRRLRLQPMYVSVHATDPKVRNFLMGRKASRDVMETLRLLAESELTMHTQVVLCPGINDGEVLEKTVHDLASLYPAVASIAIVPVGLTRYRKQRGLWPFREVGKEDSITLINKINRLQKLFKVKYKNMLVFLGDEFYLQADHPFPPASDYGDFPQWENGVGMVPLLCRQWEKRKRKGSTLKTERSPDFLVVTGESACPFVAPYLEWLSETSGVSLRIAAIRNRFFGRSVNVTGLVTGEDLFEQIRPLIRPDTVVLVPDVMLARESDRFLDDLGLREMEEVLSRPVVKFHPDPRSFELMLRNYLKGL